MRNQEFRFISSTDLQRLRDIHIAAKSMKDQLSAMAAECCERLQVPDDGSDEADLARSIVEHEADPDRVIVELFYEP